MAKQKPRRDIYQEVTDRILNYLEQGVVPWRNPIRRGSGDGWPKNLASGKRYRGINVLLLSMRAWESGYSSDYWMTFKQAKAAGGQVRKGEKGSLVTFWKLYAKDDPDTGEELRLPVLKHYTAFHVEQIDGIEIPDAPVIDPTHPEWKPIEQAEQLVAGYSDKPSIKIGGNRAVYRPLIDTVMIPSPERFDTGENYYSTLFHELSHSTGHSSRLNRGLDTELVPFGSPDYSREELVAEMSSAFLCAVAGISPPTIEQAASYIDGWRRALKGDKRLVITAAAAAQKSADWILGTKFAEAATDHDAEEGREPAKETSPTKAAENSENTKHQLDLF